MIDTIAYMIQSQLYALQAVLIHINKPKVKCCDICGWHGKYFKSFYNHRTRLKEATICPKCGSVDRTRFIYQYLKDKLDCKSEVLDVGIAEVKLVNKISPESHVVSIDIVDNGATHIMDLTDLKFYDNSFDAIICLAILQSIKDEVKAISEMYRVLKPNGEALIYVPLGYHGDPHGTKAQEFEMVTFNGCYRTYELNDFTAKLENVGFKVDYLPFEINGGFK